MKILALVLLPFSFLFANPAKKGVEATVRVHAGIVKQAGFFITSDGDLLTLWEPLQNQKEITIEHQNIFYPATLRSHDEAIAHLEIHGHNFPCLQIGSPPSQGEWGLIGGYAFRYAYVRRTMVTGKHREYLVLDTPLNPNELGGPLLNLNGDVIGINKSNEENLGLAIPLE